LGCRRVIVGSIVTAARLPVLWIIDVDALIKDLTRATQDRWEVAYIAAVATLQEILPYTTDLRHTAVINFVFTTRKTASARAIAPF